MAQSVSPLPVALQDIPATASRSNSLISTASSTASSTHSASSLRRRSRTRTRTLPSGRKGKSLHSLEASNDAADDPRAVTQVDQVPPVPLLFTSEPENIPDSSKPVIPNNSPRNLQSTSQHEHHHFLAQTLLDDAYRDRAPSTPVSGRDLKLADPPRGRQTRSEGGSLRASRAAIRGSSLPRHPLASAASSDDSSQSSPRTPPDLPHPPPRMSEDAHRPARDSLISQISSTSSSLYPRSTSSSHPESSIHPHSLKDPDEDVSSFSPRIVSHSDRESDFNVDDVSYRLRLLVNNNYFLPPAHSKPSPLSFAPPASPNTTQKPTKPAAPTFLGFFGLGKSKPKSGPISLANPPSDAPAPILRTTSDSTSASGHASRPLPRSLPQTPMHRPFQVPHSASASRVVVLREKVDDLAAAAKQAEQEIKGRKSLQAARNNFIDDVIDPTDAVDLPPSANGSLFAVQASALNGLGVGDSVGAAVLADRLPPSPGMWSMSTEEDSWRKALLTEAVHHSLNNTPDVSFSSSAASSPPPPEPQSPRSFRSSDARPSDETPVSSTPKPARIGQRILEPDQINAKVGIPAPELPPTSLYPVSPMALSMTLGQDPPLSPWGHQNETTPLRAETPALTTPLAPPPRRGLVNPTYSLSQADLPTSAPDSDFSQMSDSAQFLRRVVSSPRLSAMHEDEIQQRGLLMMTPPPIPHVQQRRSPVSSSSAALHADTLRTISSRYTITESQYSDDDGLSYSTPQGDMDEVMPRPSLSVSLHTDGRPSLSEYSHPSPTASAFQDALFGSCRSPSPLMRRSHASSLEAFVPAESNNPPRSATFSPPPRASSSLAHTILSPPPRSPATKPVFHPSISGNSNSSGRSSHPSTPLPSVVRVATTPNTAASSSYHSLPTEVELEQEIEVTSIPQQPLAERRGHGPTLSLRIPTDTISPTIHSAPAPASPTAFFDRIQSHPNAMDDLETSDESDEDEDDGAAVPPSLALSHSRTRIVLPPRPFATTTALEPRTRTFSNTEGSSSTGLMKSSLMRLGNHSTPHLSPPSSSGRSADHPYPPLPFEGGRGLVDRSPVGNVPLKGTFFASKKKGMKGKAAGFPGISDPATFSQTSARVLGPRPGTTGGSDCGGGRGGEGSVYSESGRRRSTTSDGAPTSKEKVRTWQRESLQKFDGIVLQHMAAERDTLKRITTNISTSRG